tara:strand:- start:250 stop:1491 length:1242 start_codon:yes stop_codon:yes gene_type:complete
MSGLVISPDGKWMWTGSEWIPSPPTNIIESEQLADELTTILDGLLSVDDRIHPQSLSIHDSMVMGDVKSDDPTTILNDLLSVDERTHPQSLSIRDSVVMGDVNQVYNDEEEMQLMVYKAQLLEIVSKINFYQSNNDYSNFYSEIGNVVRFTTNYDYQSTIQEIINDSTKHNWSNYVMSVAKIQLRTKTYGLEGTNFTKWYFQYSDRFVMIDRMVEDLLRIHSLGQKPTKALEKMCKWRGVELMSGQMCMAVLHLTDYSSHRNLLSDFEKSYIPHITYYCLRDYYTILFDFESKYGSFKSLHGNDDILIDLHDKLNYMGFLINDLNPLRITTALLGGVSLLLGALGGFGIGLHLGVGVPVFLTSLYFSYRFWTITKSISHTKATISVARTSLDFNPLNYNFGSSPGNELRENSL